MRQATASDVSAVQGRHGVESQGQFRRGLAFGIDHSQLRGVEFWDKGFP